MRRKKRVDVEVFPFAPPEEIRWVVPERIEAPEIFRPRRDTVTQPYEPAVPEPKKQPLEEPRR
jgi:hypothetical protein